MALSNVPLALYSACIVLYSTHLLLLEFRKKQLPTLFVRVKSLRILPVVSLFLSVVIVFTSARTDRTSSQQCPQDGEINPDIGGIGVLLGLFLPSIALAVLLILGHTMAEASGTKELCVAQIASMEAPLRSAVVQNGLVVQSDML
jgi:hypothetical protein